MSKFKIIFLVLMTVVVGWSGYILYQYFFDMSCPEIVLNGVCDGSYCSGDVHCTLLGSDEYKVSNVSVLLDNESLIKSHVINKKNFEYSFPIATRALMDGKHKLKVEVQDASFKKNVTTKEVNFIVDNVPLRAAFVTSDLLHKVFQGKTFHVQFQVNKPIKNASIEILSKKYSCIQEAENSFIYECFVPISSDENPNEYIFTITVTDLVGNEINLSSKLQIIMFPFKKQYLSVSQAKLKSEEEVGLPEKQFEEDMRRLALESSPKKLWSSAFYVPCDMSDVTTPFGTLRTTQERGKYRHDALDLIAPPKSVIWASQDGIVVLKERYVHSGNTVVLDHGCGVLSAYFHLDSFADIKMGDFVKKGKPLGRLGMTGYATGYHLHWEIRVNNIPVDPMQWTRHDF